MIHAFHSDRWLGYAALVFVALAILLRELTFGPQSVRVVLGVCLLVFGSYSAVRGMFIGGRPCRICAALSSLFWAWVLYLIFMALQVQRVKLL